MALYNNSERQREVEREINRPHIYIYIMVLEPFTARSKYPKHFTPNIKNSSSEQLAILIK